MNHRFRSRSWSGRLAVFVVLVCAAAVAGSWRVAVADECGPPCRRGKNSCVVSARKSFHAKRKACSTDSPKHRACRRDARISRVDTVETCRTERRTECRRCCELGGVAGINNCRALKGVFLPAEPQDEGDPVVGREILLSGDFMTCGIPAALWDISIFQPAVASSYGGVADAPRISNRGAANADMPYFLNRFESTDGNEVINGNCLMCHGGMFDGELVIGLPNANADFTGSNVDAVGQLTDEALGALGLDEGEIGEWHKFSSRAEVVGPHTTMRTVGMNPAETLAVILMVHHDRDTLEWSDEPLIEVVPKDENGAPIEDALLTSDAAPWWRVHKKNALFYNGMARGDHRGTMALATSVCVDSVDRAAEVDALFKDLQAFVGSVRAPKYPRTIDAALADQGKSVFERDCAACHGTYAERDEDEFYPNLLIPLDVVRTDPAVAKAGVVHSPELVEWYNESFYGGLTRMEPNDPFPGYMPPPLDGIWATAPFLHNGSVPTIALLLNSRSRPEFWRRVDLDSTNYDEEALGWPWLAVEGTQADAPEEERALIYDTTYWSQSNDGHPFGDHLTRSERRAVIEYLKTL